MADSNFPDIGIKPYYEDDYRVLYHGDCREMLLLVSGVSAVVTDPPYELGFMGKHWDKAGVSFLPEVWELVRQSCLPGSPMLAFGGSRTQHRIACAIEDAGWDIRDTLMWVYGSGFPKSLDISKAIDKAVRGVPQGGSDPTSPHHGRYATQASVGKRGDDDKGQQYGSGSKWMVDGGGWESSDRELVMDARLWNGYGTALKPAYEPIILAMNPLDKTFANNALEYGVAGLNIDGCRVLGANGDGHWTHKRSIGDGNIYHSGGREDIDFGNQNPSLKGRFPANFLHDGSEEVLELFPSTGGGGKPKLRNRVESTVNFVDSRLEYEPYRDTRNGGGSAARFFYCAKASRKERNAGCENIPSISAGQMTGGRAEGSAGLDSPRAGADRTSGGRNHHPTVKPLALIEYLCKLVKMPEYNLILDPFCGSGTTLLACGSLGVKSIGIEMSEEYCEIAANRCASDIVDRIRRGEL